MVNKSSGFTLIELFVILAIISTIAAMAFASYKQSRSPVQDVDVVNGYEVMVDNELQRCDADGGNCKPVE